MATVDPENSWHVFAYDDKAIEKMHNMLLDIVPSDEGVIVMCVGSNKNAGDSIGPLIGSNLRDRFGLGVIGTMDTPINGNNINQYILKLKLLRPSDFVLVVNPAFGKECNIGNIRVKRGPIRPGLRTREVGSASIVPVVAKNSRISNERAKALRKVTPELRDKIVKIISLSIALLFCDDKEEVLYGL